MEKSKVGVPFKQLLQLLTDKLHYKKNIKLNSKFLTVLERREEKAFLDKFLPVRMKQENSG